MSLSDILTKCRSGVDHLRNGAELEIDNKANIDFGGLLEECSKEMAEESVIKENRQLCATIIKNMIRPEGKHGGKWEQLPFEQKGNIKNNVLSCLASSIKDVRKAAALTVAGKEF
jgi:hypothetical protein